MCQRHVAVAFVIVLIGLGAGLGTAASATLSGSSLTKPTLRLGKRAPLTLKALGFKAGERVVVAVTHGAATVKKRARASRTGSFVVRFTELAVGPCDALSAIAHGNLGSFAVSKFPPRACSEG